MDPFSSLRTSRTHYVPLARAGFRLLYRHESATFAIAMNQVVVAARREDMLQEVADEIKAAGGEAVVVVGDVSRVRWMAAETKVLVHLFFPSLHPRGIGKRGVFRSHQHLALPLDRS